MVLRCWYAWDVIHCVKWKFRRAAMYVQCVPWSMSLVRQNVNCVTQSWLVSKKRVQLAVSHQTSLSVALDNNHKEKNDYWESEDSDCENIKKSRLIKLSKMTHRIPDIWSVYWQESDSGRREYLQSKDCEDLLVRLWIGTSWSGVGLVIDISRHPACCIGNPRLWLVLPLLSIANNRGRACCSLKETWLKIWFYYSFKIFSRFWLVKTTRIIHHNQVLFTKFGKNLRNIELMTSKVERIKNYWTNDVKMTSKVQPAADYWTVDRENLGTRLCYIWWAEKLRA